jgi:hypothetical protein
MDKHELFEIWAPRGGVWSAWAKPVLFAHLPRPLPLLAARPPLEVGWVPPAAERWAVVVDLPGAESVRLGVVLAGRGYLPAPLFNACPPPVGPDGKGVAALVDVESVLAALVGSAGPIRQLGLPADAPPAFLVDADRQRLSQPIRPGLFDNRSVLFVTDFPSAQFLAAQRIERVLLVCAQPSRIERDLAYVLWTWQRAGVALRVKRGTDPGPIEPLTVGGRWFLFNLWHRLTAALLLRRNPQGGYGGLVPEASSG